MHADESPLLYRGRNRIHVHTGTIETIVANSSKYTGHDFKGIGCSKIGYFKEVQHKIKELEKLNLSLAQRCNRLEAIFNSISDGLTILDRELNIVFWL